MKSGQANRATADHEDQRSGMSARWAADPSPGALRGIKVLDVSAIYPGPYCSLVLADMGADVVKVEPPGIGDPMREISHSIFRSVNRNKKSIVLDLKREPGREAFQDLACWADVVVEGFRPGVAARLNIDYETLSALNSSLIYCSLSGYGQDGPYRDWVGHDLNYVGVSGAAAVGGEPDGRDDWSTTIPVADVAGALFAANSILAALIWRGTSGRGQYLDVSLTDAMVALTGLRIVDYFGRGRPSKPELIAKGAMGIFYARDGKGLTLAALEDKFFQRLCNAIGRPDLSEDSRYAERAVRNRHWKALHGVLAEEFLKRDRNDWVSLFVIAEVPCAPAHQLDDLLGDPQICARSLLLREPDEFIDVAFPVKLSETPWTKRFEAPALGQHTEEIMQLIGYDSARAARIAADV